MLLRITGVYLTGTLPTGVVPRTPAPAPLPWARGADGTIQVVVIDESGAPVNLASSSLVLGCRRLDSDSIPLFTRAGTVTDAVNGVCDFAIAAADTEGLAPGGYRYDVWLTDASGRQQIVRASAFTVLESETRSSESGGSSAPIPPVVTGAVDTVNGPSGTMLSAVVASQLTDGFLLYVRDHDAYFNIQIGKGLPVDHDTVETALDLPGGQWVIFSGGGGGTGPRGPAGRNGDRGRRGDGGERGRRGRPGRAGADGTIGRDGTDGRKGRRGEDGSRGRRGRPGRDGVDGTDGTIGRDGRAGRRGEDGERGRRGRAGRAGADGTIGTNGRDGSNGRKGRKGEEGMRGRRARTRMAILQDYLLPEPPGFDIRYRPMANIFNDIEFWKPGSSGGGSCPDGGPYAGPGVTGAICGNTTAASFASVQWAINDRTIYFDANVGLWKAETRIAVSAVPSSGQFGYLLSGIANLSTFYGVYFRIDAASANYQCVCKNASGTTTVNSGVAVPTTSTGTDRTLYKTLRVVVSRDGDQARFFIGNALVATITTNIPDNTINMQQYAFHLNNDADSIARKCWMTYVRLRLDPPAE
jgi:hypothetical protein